MFSDKQYTIGQCLNKAKHELQKAGIESYALDADLLLSSVLDISREKLILNTSQQTSSKTLSLFGNLLKRRCNREPLSHILGVRDFWKQQYFVDKNVLDPRPDSEALIEYVLQLFEKQKNLEILDLGTGSGCLLLSLLNEYEAASGVGVDISKEALKIATKNAGKYNLENRVSFIKSNWGEKISSSFDLIISNPPYIKTDEIITLQPEVALYEPKTALDGGIDGLDEYRRLVFDIKKLLTQDGFAILEHGIGQEDDIKDIFEQNGFVFVENIKDLSTRNRAIVVKLA